MAVKLKGGLVHVCYPTQTLHECFTLSDQAVWHRPSNTPVFVILTPGSHQGPTFYFSVQFEYNSVSTSHNTAEARWLMGKRLEQNCKLCKNYKTELKPNSCRLQPPGHHCKQLIQLTSRLTSLTGGNFFLHSMDRDRRSVCMFSSNFFTASGLLVDIFDGLFDINLRKR